MRTQICGNYFMVLKIAPALNISEDQLGEFVLAIGDIVGLMHSSASFWSEPLGIV